MQLLLVRHADAGSRRAWDAPDHLRPLSNKGQRRAEELAQILDRFGIARLLSSHYVRCVETIAPLAKHIGVEVEIDDALGEGTSLASGIDLLERLIADGQSAALCSHGDVIPELLAGLARRGADIDPDGRCPKGSVWILEVEDGAITRAVYGGTRDLTPS